MADRGSWAAFAVGVAGFCVLGLTSGHFFAAIGLMALSAAALVAGVASFQAVRHRRLVRGLKAVSEPAQLEGLAVRTGEMTDAAFVAGLGRPTIYCDRRLPDRLSPDQLRAVLLHERAHQRSADPARLLLLGVVVPLARWVPFGRTWVAWMLAQREIAADRYALTHGATRDDLAGALMTLPPLASAHVVGFTSAVDLRLRALLGDEVTPDIPLVLRRGVQILAGLAVGGGICAWFLHRFLAVTVGLVCC